jgi:hypothetical protein
MLAINSKPRSEGHDRALPSLSRQGMTKSGGITYSAILIQEAGQSILKLRSAYDMKGR